MINEDVLIERMLDIAFDEDIATGDITTNSIIARSDSAVAELKMKADGIISGLAVARKVFDRFPDKVEWEQLVQDGDSVHRGQIILRMRGSYRTLLQGERLALNLLQRMSGIATETARYVAELRGTKTRILDTRKTAPGLRVCDKMAVRHGGGLNHRMGLHDMVLLKDNHIKAAGSIAAAVEAVRRTVPVSVKVEVETATLDEVREAVELDVDVIMLDNMDTQTMKEAIDIIDGRCYTEASGNMTRERLAKVAAVGVDFISVGALTHSVTALDISMNFVPDPV